MKRYLITGPAPAIRAVNVSVSVLMAGNSAAPEMGAHIGYVQQAGVKYGRRSLRP